MGGSISTDDYGYYAFIDGEKVRVVYDHDGLIRLVNATRNIYVEY